MPSLPMPDLSCVDGLEVVTVDEAWQELRLGRVADCWNFSGLRYSKTKTATS